jgi:hypothetical protein
MVLPAMPDYTGGLRMKIVKSYSIDLQTAQLLERYPSGKKSEVVNEAIAWYVGNRHISEAIEEKDIIISALRDQVRALRKPSLLHRILLRMRVVQ